MHESMSYSKFRGSMKSAIDMVCADHIPLLITRKHGGEVVVLSADDYRGMEETLYLLSSPKNAEKLLASLERVKKGQYKERELLDETDV